MRGHEENYVYYRVLFFNGKGRPQASCFKEIHSYGSPAVQTGCAGAGPPHLVAVRDVDGLVGGASKHADLSDGGPLLVVQQREHGPLAEVPHGSGRSRPDPSRRKIGGGGDEEKGGRCRIITADRKKDEVDDEKTNWASLRITWKSQREPEAEENELSSHLIEEACSQTCTSLHISSNARLSLNCAELQLQFIQTGLLKNNKIKVTKL